MKKTYIRNMQSLVREMDTNGVLHFFTRKEVLVPMRANQVMTGTTAPLDFPKIKQLHKTGSDALQPGYADVAIARKALQEAFQLANDAYKNNRKSELNEQDKQTLSSVYSGYATLLYQTEPLQKNIKEIESLIERALELDPNNEQAQDVRRDLSFNWKSPSLSR